MFFDLIDEGKRCWLSVRGKDLETYRAFMQESIIPRYPDPGSHKGIEGGYFSHKQVAWLVKWLIENGAKGVFRKDRSRLCG